MSTTIIYQGLLDLLIIICDFIIVAFIHGLFEKYYSDLFENFNGYSLKRQFSILAIAIMVFFLFKQFSLNIEGIRPGEHNPHVNTKDTTTIDIPGTTTPAHPKSPTKPNHQTPVKTKPAKAPVLPTNTEYPSEDNANEFTIDKTFPVDKIIRVFNDDNIELIRNKDFTIDSTILGTDYKKIFIRCKQKIYIK